MLDHDSRLRDEEAAHAQTPEDGVKPNKKTTAKRRVRPLMNPLPKKRNAATATVSASRAYAAAEELYI